MKATSKSTQTMLELSPLLLHRLNVYALAASAASLALAEPAEAKIVYTPAHIRILVNRLTELDLNHDGINDLQFTNIYGTQLQVHSTLSVAPAQNLNRVWAGSCSAAFGTSRCAVALPKGRTVGPRSPFQKGRSSLLMAGHEGNDTSGSYFGRWPLKTDYLALKFVIKGKTHFGWVRIQVDARSKGFVATITGYAYETVPNKPIVTGKTKGLNTIGPDQPVALRTRPTPAATLGLLAMGSPGLSVWRRDERNQEGEFR
jgi:hypothetical protein